MTQFYTTPRCCPTRAALLTGLYSHQAGIGNMMEDRGLPGYRGELNRNCPTIAEVMRAADYKTLMVGKWHVSHMHFSGKSQLNYESDEPFYENKETWPMQRGFDAFFGTIHGVCSYYDPFTLTRGNTVIKPDTADFYYTDIISDQAVKYIDEFASGSKPFFLYLAYTAPHWPLQAPEADIAKYRSTYSAGWDVIRSNRYQKQLELGVLDKSCKLSPRDSRVGDWESVKDKAWEANRMATFAAMVTRMDAGIGRVLSELKKKGVAENTLVIFMSDNGGCAEAVEPGWYDIPSRTRAGKSIKVGNGDHTVMAGPEEVWQSYGLPWANVSDTPFQLYKHFTHEGGISTPFIASWPAGITNTGSITKQVGHVTDIMATAMDLAGVDLAKGLATAGESLVPVLQGKAMVRKAPIFWEHEGNRAVREGKWKLVARHNGSWELYDIDKDRAEANNLVTAEPEQVKRLGELYTAWAKRCNVVPFEQLPRARKTVPAAKSTAAKSGLPEN